MNPILSPDHLISYCYICQGKIRYDTHLSIGVEGHGETAKLYHEQCKETSINRNRVLKLCELLTVNKLFC